MKNESKNQVESINNSSEKLLLSDVSKSVCTCIQTGLPCGFPCCSECPSYAELNKQTVL